MLASLTITPTPKPNHKKLPIPAIHAERPTPGSKLPSATKREQALALKKRRSIMTLLECAKLCFRFGKASSAGVAHHHPNAQAQPREVSPPAIHAKHPTPGSKLPSATKREQALALKKRCGTLTLLECGSPAAALAKPALLASRTITPTLKPNQEKPPPPRDPPAPNALAGKKTHIRTCQTVVSNK